MFFDQVAIHYSPFDYFLVNSNMVLKVILDAVQGAGIALLLSLIFTTWRHVSVKWDKWFPLLKGLLTITLWIGIGVGVVLATMALSKEGTNYAAFLCGALLGFIVIPAISGFTAVGPSEKLERGSAIASAEAVAKQIKKEKVKTYIELGGVPLPLSAEPYHFLIAGSTGSGKSVAINKMIDYLRERGDTAIIVDSGGEFLKRNYQAGKDFVLNPFDDRCVPWSPLAEMEGPWDAEALARSIIPNGTGESKEWNSYAQTLLMCCMQKLWERGQMSLKDLLYAVCAAPPNELQDLLANTAAAAQLASEKTLGSIRTIAANYLSSYNYLGDSQEPFSVLQFVKKCDGGFLYLTYRDDQLDSVKNLMSCVLDVAARTILSMQSDPNRRVWLIIDEFASIGKVQSIEAVATKARKVGGCLVIGLQAVSQLKDRYGEHSAQSILSCLSTWLVLRCADADTAEYMSKYIGEAEVTKTTESLSNSEQGASTSRSEQTQTQRVVLASEIQQLANCHGYLKLVGHYPVCAVKLAFPVKKDTDFPTFVPRDFKLKPLLKLEPTNPIFGQAQANKAIPQQTGSLQNTAINKEPVVVKATAPQENIKIEGKGLAGENGETITPQEAMKRLMLLRGQK